MSFDTLPAAETTPQGTPAAPVGEAGSVSATDDSLAAHEEAHSPDAKVSDPDESTERDAGGKFRPRRRAASQQADADDVPTINALTARLKAVEEQHGKDIQRKPNESDRVYNLRRRAEMLERSYTAPKAPVAAPAPVQQPQRPVQQQPLPQTFPAYEAFIAFEGNEDKTYDDYTDARSEWRFAFMRMKEQAEIAAGQAHREFTERATTHQGRVTQAKAKYADWDAVVTSELPITKVIHDAVLGSDSSAEVQYFLGTHRDVLAQLVAETQEFHPSAVAPMRRLLDSFVAEQRSPSPMRAAAGTTGSALALAPPPAPRPPNPVRTGAEAPADTPPGDDSQSLAAHEKFYHRRQR